MRESSSLFGTMRALLAHHNGEHVDYAGAAFIALTDDARREFLSEVERDRHDRRTRLYGVRWCNTGNGLERLYPLASHPSQHLPVGL